MMIDKDFIKFFSETVYKKYYGKNSVGILPRPGTSNYVRDTTSDFNEYNAYFVCKKCGVEYKEEYEIYRHMQNHFDDESVYYAIVYSNLADYMAIYFFMNKGELGIHKQMTYLSQQPQKTYAIKKGIQKDDFRAYIRVINNVKEVSF